VTRCAASAVGKGVLGSARPQCHVPEGESEDDGSDAVTSLMRSETRGGELLGHGAKVRMTR
jgi:hypothetical protein